MFTGNRTTLMTDLYVLQQLHFFGPTTINNLALALGEPRNTVAQSIEALVMAGLVRRLRAPADLRVLLLLTVAGHDYLQPPATTPVP